jgi:hypothetical protein
LTNKNKVFSKNLDQNLILDWYNNNDPHGYMGYEEAKQLARPFIEALLTNKENNKYLFFCVIY